MIVVVARTLHLDTWNVEIEHTNLGTADNQAGEMVFIFTNLGYDTSVRYLVQCNDRLNSPRLRLYLCAVCRAYPGLPASVAQRHRRSQGGHHLS